MADGLFNDVVSRAELQEAVRKLLTDKFDGLATIPALGDKADEDGLFPKEWKRRFYRQGRDTFCRQSLQAKGSDGMPFAKSKSVGRQESEEEDEEEKSRAPEWKQWELFTYEEMEEFLLRTVYEDLQDIAQLKRYCDYCERKFGKLPKIPKLKALLALAKEPSGN